MDESKDLPQNLYNSYSMNYTLDTRVFKCQNTDKIHKAFGKVGYPMYWFAMPVDELRGRLLAQSRKESYYGQTSSSTLCTSDRGS
jgi:hypothetical protein